MKITKAIKPFTIAALVLAANAAISITFGPVQAQNGNGDESKIQQGFAIAPVHLTLAGKNPELVGLGSYIVNAQASCNSCHDNWPWRRVHSLRQSLRGLGSPSPDLFRRSQRKLHSVSVQRCAPSCRGLRSKA